MDATERLVLAKGSFDEVGIREIADAVGRTPPSVYLHFEDKDALIFAVCERIFQALEVVCRDAAGGGDDPVEALRRCGRAYVRFGLDHPEHYRVMFMQPAPSSMTPILQRRVMQASGFDLVVELVRRGIEAGMFPGRDAFLLACGLWSAVHGITSLLIAKPWFPWPQTERLVDHCIDVHCRGLVDMREE